MRAVILAAGRGRRLGALTETKPKCLLKIANTTIVEHQINNLRVAGIHDITLVIGYGAEHVREHLGDRVNYIYNHKHETTDSLYSLWLAREIASEGLLILNSDVVFHPQILRRLIQSDYPDALTIELKRDFDAEQMKVQIEGERVVRLSKELPVHEAKGENLGILKFSYQGAQQLFRQIERLVSQGIVNRWCTYAISEVARYYPIHYVATSGLPWVEIDFAADLTLAQNIVYPQIQAHKQRQKQLINVDVPPKQQPFIKETALPLLIGQTMGRD